MFLYLFIDGATKIHWIWFQDSWFNHWTRYLENPNPQDLHHPYKFATKMMDIAQWNLGVVVKLVVADASFGAPSWNMWDHVEVSLKIHSKWWWISSREMLLRDLQGSKIQTPPWSPLLAKGCPQQQWILTRKSRKGSKLACGTCNVDLVSHQAIHMVTGNPVYKHIIT